MTALEVLPSEYHKRLGVKRDNIFREDSWLSKSALWQLNSVSLWRWRFAPPKSKSTLSMSWGSLVDCLLTTPEEFEDTFVFNPYKDFRSKAAQEFRDKCKAEWKQIISVEDHEAAQMAVQRLQEDPIAGPVIASSRKQVVLLNKLKGVQFKGLVDLAPANEPILYDLKTINKFSLRGISSSIHDYGYHVQAALYLKLWNLCHPDDQRNRFRFIWQCNEAPFEVAVTELPAFDICAGDEWAAHQMERLISATKSGQWPGITQNKVALVGRPGYAAYQDEEEIEGVVEAP